MHFRAAQVNDSPVLLELLNLMSIEERAKGCRFSREPTKQFLEHLINDTRNPFTVCTDRSRIVAFGYGQQKRGMLLLHNFFVLPGFRKRGIATTIFGRIVNLAHARKKRLIAYVLSKNAYALEFWQRKGFVIDRKLSNAVRVSRN